MIIIFNHSVDLELNSDTGYKLLSHEPIEVNGGMTYHVTPQLSMINTDTTT